MLNETIIQHVMPDLSNEKDTEMALRKALLTLIALVQEDTTHTTQVFIQYLLRKFPPLSKAFQKNCHPMIQDIEWIRKIGSDKQCRLFVPVTFWEKTASTHQNEQI